MSLLMNRLIMKLSRVPNICRKKYYEHLICGDGFRLGDEVIMFYPQNITIGEGTYINGGHIIASPNAHIKIGENCLISYNVHIRTDMHNYNDTELICKQGFSEKDIFIGNDVWVGFGAQIMPGVCVADGCVLGAGAVVTKSTEPYGVYVGVPAKLIKYRNRK